MLGEAKKELWKEIGGNNILLFIVGCGGIMMATAMFLVTNNIPLSKVATSITWSALWVAPFIFGVVCFAILILRCWKWSKFTDNDKKEWLQANVEEVEAANLDIIRAKEVAEKNDYIWDELNGRFEYLESEHVRKCFLYLMGDKSTFEYGNPIRAIHMAAPYCPKCNRSLIEQDGPKVQCPLCENIYSKKSLTQYREDIKNAFFDKIRLLLEKHDENAKKEKVAPTEAAR